MPRIRTRLPQFQEDDFSDDAFFKRFRFTKDGFNHLVNFIGDDIPEPENNRGRPLSPRTQLLVALRYYATDSFQIVHRDLQGVSQPSATTFNIPSFTVYNPLPCIIHTPFYRSHLRENIIIILSIIRTPFSQPRATVSVRFVHGQRQMSLHTNCYYWVIYVITFISIITTVSLCNR